MVAVFGSNREQSRHSRLAEHFPMADVFALRAAGFLTEGARGRWNWGLGVASPPSADLEF
jgi:hypothetical protein